MNLFLLYIEKKRTNFSTSKSPTDHRNYLCIFNRLKIQNPIGTKAVFHRERGDAGKFNKITGKGVIASTA